MATEGVEVGQVADMRGQFAREIAKQLGYHARATATARAASAGEMTESTGLARLSIVALLQ